MEWGCIGKSLGADGSLGDLVDERDDDCCEEDDDDDIQSALDADVPSVHLARLLVGRLDLPADLVALRERGSTMLIWFWIFSFWSPNSRMMLLLVFWVSLATRFIIRRRLVWS